MNLPAAIALAVIAAFFVLVVVIRIRAKRTTRVTLDRPDRVNAPGDRIPCRVTVTALRPATLESVAVELACRNSDARYDRQSDREGIMYRLAVPHEIGKPITPDAPFVLDVEVALPEPGSSGAVLMKPADPDSPARTVWAVTAEVLVDGLTVTGGDFVQTRSQ